MIRLPRTTDNSTYFAQSLEIRGIESKLYMFWGRGTNLNTGKFTFLYTFQILESSQTLLNVLKRESQSLREKSQTQASISQRTARES